MQKLSLSVAALAGVLFSVSAGCASEPAEDDEGVDESEGALAGARSVSLKYEGTCDFLRTCSTWSKSLPAGQVNWGCTGRGVCSDSALWVAGPSRSYCGQSVRICKGSQCTTALVKDVSVSRDWEASNGVLDALDLPHGLRGQCSGFGGGNVTLSVSGSGGGGATTPPPPDNGAPTGGGCYSATLGGDVEELACVQSRTSGWMQCNSGKWYRGVSGNDGPFGRCKSLHPLR